jgi:hypothetical protein
MSAKVHLQAQLRQLTLDGKVDLGVDRRAVSFSPAFDKRKLFVTFEY